MNDVSRNTKALSWIVILAVVSPPAISFSISGFVLNPIRVVGIVLFPWLLLRYFSEASIRSRLDLLFISHLFFVFISLAYNHGLYRGIEAGGVYVLDSFPYYLIGKMIARQEGGIYYLVRSVIRSLYVIIPCGLFEMFTGYNLFYDLFNVPYYLVDAPRFGLDRASFTLPHPILYGLFVSAFVGFFLYSKRRKLPLVIFMGFGIFASLSSAPFLAFFIQLVIWGWIKLIGDFRKAVRSGVIVAISIYGALAIVVVRPVHELLVSFISFNASTAWYRLITWEFGLMNVAQSPILGIGFHDWFRPGWMYSGSVDAFWLLTTMRHGIPSTIFLLLSVIFLLVQAARIRNDDIAESWFISMIGIIFVGITVHFWMGVFSMFWLFLGIGSGYFLKRSSHVTRG